ncbi:hypothetical protein L1987_48984 [Smallanthus sonchifolius]|uniref:Uncharacterized protein n=1 Tax=Smallanthus sonchifolius TaxID=185202 RepID=A0ACB9FST9_9ASTR|nr:hypothetical protein L1987_48984 [Smallanthus sonchifolius]
MQNSSSSKLPSQVWLQYGSRPNGTIPIRRSSNNHQTIRPTKIIVTQNHSFSVALTEGYSYSGAKGNIKVWNPYVESDSDYSSSQVMLRNGPLKIYETVQAGWAVNPIVYNDTKTRLFAYWSDPGTNNWWLTYNDKEVGYWPGDIFRLMKYQATLVQWGGEVYSPKVGTHPHTATAMGNGEFPDKVFRHSGTMTGMLIEANSNPLKHPDPDIIFVSSDEGTCYDAFLLKKTRPP